MIIDRETQVTWATGPEQLRFTPEEGQLCVKALSYYMATQLQSLEANWDRNAYVAMVQTSMAAMEDIERTATFVGLYKGLAAKFNNGIINPRKALEISPEELMAVGDALFRFGNIGFTHARNATQSRVVGFTTSSDRFCC